VVGAACGSPHSAAADARVAGSAAEAVPKSRGVGSGADAAGGRVAGGAPAGGAGWGSPSRSMASRISACTAEDQCRTSATNRPIWRPASGRRLGPSTISATTKMTRISAGPKELGMDEVYRVAVLVLPAAELVERRPEAPNILAQAP